MEQFTLKVNGDKYNVLAEPRWTLLHVLREVIGITGPKPGCLTGDCGGCKVIIDGVAKNSCTTLLKQCSDSEIITIEALSMNGSLDTIQKAFVSKGAVQCGYCTPGMVMSAKALLDKNPNPTIDEVKEGIDNNLCRCTGYKKIIEAILLASELLSKECGCHE